MINEAPGLLRMELAMVNLSGSPQKDDVTLRLPRHRLCPRPRTHAQLTMVALE